jgi:hypothetical protein
MTGDDDSNWLHRNNTFTRSTSQDLNAPAQTSERQGSLDFCLKCAIVNNLLQSHLSGLL